MRSLAADQFPHLQRSTSRVSWGGEFYNGGSDSSDKESDRISNEQLREREALWAGLTQKDRP